MISQCPRCGTPRMGEYPVCQSCGFDFRLAGTAAGTAAAAPQGQYPPQQPSYGAQPPVQPQPQPNPYGQPQGYGQPYGAPRNSMMPIALAVVAVAILVAAGALFFIVAQGHSSASSSPSAAATEVAIATPTEAPTPEVTPTQEAVATPTPVVKVTPTLGGTTGGWTQFSAPDGKWTVSFPGTESPTKATEPITSGGLSGTFTMYSVTGTTSAYIVGYIDFPASSLAGKDTTALLTTLETAMNTSLGGTVTADAAVTVGGYAAREVSISTSSLDYVYEEFFVGSRWYWLVTGGASGSDLQSDQFFSSFSLS